MTNGTLPTLFTAEAAADPMKKYMPIGDVTVLALCIILFMLLIQTFVRKDKYFKYTIIMIVLVYISSTASLMFNTLAASDEAAAKSTAVYILRLVHYVSLCMVPIIYTVYIQEPLRLHASRKFFDSVTAAIFVIAVSVDLIMTRSHNGFYISADGTAHFGFNIFSYMYAMFYGSIIYSTIKHRDRLLSRVFSGLMSVNIVSLATMLVQGFFGQTSYTNAACIFPVIGIIYLFHSNPYDTEIGTVSETFFYPEHDKRIERKEQFVLISCIIRGFLNALRESNDLMTESYAFLRRNARNGVLYRFPDDRILLSLPADANIENLTRRMTDEFKELYERFRLDYKLVVCRSTRSVTSAKDYIKLIEYAEKNTAFTNIHYIDENDINDFYDSGYILGELAEIASRRDLDDPRVLVYCQPVYNIRTGKYDTAEALMRLQLDKTGIVYPDVFIPLAEQNNCIHALSLIILNKTCRAIREMLENGYDIQRISVNFSAIDLRYGSFCGDVKNIIAGNGIPFGKIAVEITESRSESDFNLMKQRVIELRQLGIKFYLDDFGTGYSNFERIMEIPFDIIKFDRSMLIESNRSESGEFMVKTFAGMFKKLNYSVLFEGVEDDRDEQHCIGMQASYLQGYKYSRPIPIENLRDFLTRTA